MHAALREHHVQHGAQKRAGREGARAYREMMDNSATIGALFVFRDDAELFFLGREHKAFDELRSRQIRRGQSQWPADSPLPTQRAIAERVPGASADDPTGADERQAVRGAADLNPDSALSPLGYVPKSHFSLAHHGAKARRTPHAF